MWLQGNPTTGAKRFNAPAGFDLTPPCRREPPHSASTSPVCNYNAPCLSSPRPYTQAPGSAAGVANHPTATPRHRWASWDDDLAQRAYSAPGANGRPKERGRPAPRPQRHTQLAQCERVGAHAVAPPRAAGGTSGPTSVGDWEAAARHMQKQIATVQTRARSARADGCVHPPKCPWAAGGVVVGEGRPCGLQDP